MTFWLPWRTAPHEYSVYTEYFFSISAVYTQYSRKNPFFSNIFKSEWSIYFVYTFELVKKTDLSGKYIYILGISLIYSCWKKCISTDSGKKSINFGEASKNISVRSIGWETWVVMNKLNSKNNSNKSRKYIFCS